MSVNKGRPAGRRGRPRAFDVEEVLDRALQVFWRKGYEGASLDELTGAMGISRPSLYAAFGDKEGLFRKALDHYADGPLSFTREALKEPTARAAVERLLLGAVKMQADPDTPPGCLMVHGALACGEGSDSIRQELNSRRAAYEADLRRRLVRAKAEGDLPPDANPADLARYFVTVVRGMAVEAAGGASSHQLRRVVRLALRAWPE
jgi:AcrR family transcriptional regulator